MTTTLMGTGRANKWQIAVAALSIILAVLTLGLLAILHFLSPEFDPSFRMVSEYALGHYSAVLSLMFLAWAFSTWTLALSLRDVVQTKVGKFGGWLLVVAGIGEALAAVFDINHEAGHGIAGLLGVLGFPVAALLLSVNLGRHDTWRNYRKALLWLANLNWISVVLLIGSLVLLTLQMTKANGGHLPQHAPSHLPDGVLGLDGWADRLIILTNCLWLVTAALPLARLLIPGDRNAA